MSAFVSPGPTVRLATPSDLEVIMAIERVGWPSGEGMRAEAAKFAHRIECGFVWVACDPKNSVLGMFTAFRPTWARAEQLDALISSCPNDFFDRNTLECWRELCHTYDLPRDWHEATEDGTLENGAIHEPRGSVVFGVGLTVRPEFQGRGLARTLMQSALGEAARHGARYFLGYGRLPVFHRFSGIDIDRYLRMTQRNGLGLQPLDPHLRMHWRLGAQPIRSVDSRYRYVGIPGAMRDDPESRGYGLLVVAPLGAEPFPLERFA